MPYHGALTANHRLETWSYANAGARTGATGFVAGDVGKIAYQQDDGSYWRLTATAPTWVQSGGASAAPSGSAGGALTGTYPNPTLAVAPLHNAYALFTWEDVAGSQGGTFTSGAWRTRPVNTEKVDTASIASVAANQITLAIGTYDCHIRSSAYYVEAHQARLYNVTDAAELLAGTTEFTEGTTGDGSMSSSEVIGRFTLAGTRVLEVQHRCQTTKGTSGFGSAAGWTTEVYCVAEFWRVS